MGVQQNMRCTGVTSRADLGLDDMGLTEAGLA